MRVLRIVRWTDPRRVRSWVVVGESVDDRAEWTVVGEFATYDEATAYVRSAVAANQAIAPRGRRA